MGLQRLHVAARYSGAAIFNGVVYLAGMVPECEAKDIRSQTADVLAGAGLVPACSPVCRYGWGCAAGYNCVWR
jgi:hypothetical protein